MPVGSLLGVVEFAELLEPFCEFINQGEARADNYAEAAG